MSTSPASEPRQTLNQFGIAVAALIVGSALLFFAIGAVGATSDDEPSSAATSAAPTASDTASASAPSAPADTGTDAPAQVVESSDGATPATTPTTTSQPTGDATTSAPEVDEADRVDPAEISVQVLDAIRDGSTTARDFADDIDAAGYDLVAFLTAGRTYEQTTVFYSSGREALARQIADEFGWTLVRANDVGLSEDVDVGVVVGASQN